MGLTVQANYKCKIENLEQKEEVSKRKTQQPPQGEGLIQRKRIEEEIGRRAG